jgi:AefR-like transcriptional repressor, C-terminal domain
VWRATIRRILCGRKAQQIRGFVASLSRDDVNFGYMLGAWLGEATQRGLMQAGLEFFGTLLSEEQLALYRVVTRDADRFPELGQHYQKNVARGRTGILIAYPKSVALKRSWTRRDATQNTAFL